MTTLYYDTETTGLLAKGAPAGSASHPHICQLAAQLVANGRAVASLSLLVKPHNWGIPAEAAAIHGITTEMCEQFGLPIKTVLTLFGRMAQRAERKGGHNNKGFDDLLIWTEFIRCDAMAEMAAFLSLETFDTMEMSTPILNLPPSQRMIAAGYGDKPKAPRLGEAYEFFTGKPFEGAHDAMADVVGCRFVHEAILERVAKAASEPLCLD